MKKKLSPSVFSIEKDNYDYDHGWSLWSNNFDDIFLTRYDITPLSKKELANSYKEISNNEFLSSDDDYTLFYYRLQLVL